MQEAIREGLDLTQQLIALPFKVAREAFRQTALSRRPVGEIVTETLHLGEDVAKLPWKAAAALMVETSQRKPGLEARVAELERRLELPPAGDTAPE